MKKKFSDFFLIKKIGKIWKNLGPGLITGASDDDPSGIATYSQAGARYGFQLLWTALITYPLVVVIQEMCARIGIVTREGLTANIKKYYPRYILYFILILSAPTIILNIGANIAGMGAVGNLIIPFVPSYVFSVFFTIVMMYSFIFWSYNKIASVLKWLCITLVCYILIPFTTKTDWPLVFKNLLIPNFSFDKEFFLMLVGILGTTISPYLFFWQASMEVEERIEKKLVVDKKIISNMETDVKGGMFFTNLVFFFIILTTGSVLFKQGMHDIETVQDAAKALQPLAGNMAYLLFSVGVIGTGFLAIPVLAGSLSYMMSETFGWQEGLNKKFHEAQGFYLTMIVSLIIGLAIHLTGISPIRALIFTAVLYGITAPVLIGLIIHMCNQPRIMGKFVNKKSGNIIAGLTLLIMTFSVFFLLYYYLIS